MGMGVSGGGVGGLKTCVSISAIYLHPRGTNRARCVEGGRNNMA